MGSNPTPSATALLWCYNLLISCVFFQGAGFVNKGSGIGFSNMLLRSAFFLPAFSNNFFNSSKSSCEIMFISVACQRVLYILPLGFVPIYFFSKSFK
ncbi:hypothetical protein, partial [Bartonella sp. AA131HXZ]|uniref:hypothetical protein n=1 Tax=Bartonella sp. AA131HXZ TaxID=1460967 RepID=UPI0035CFC9B8